MPASIPTRPAAGAVIDTAWGQDVHDRIYSPKGIIASGTAVVVPAATLTNLNLSVRSGGDPAWLVGDGISLRVPVGKSGWFACSVFVTISSAAAGVALRLGLYRNGSLMAGANSNAIGTTVSWMAFPVYVQGSDGDTFTLQGYSSAANASFSVARLSIIRSSDVGVAGS